jgi:hypothetical protein
MHTNVSLSETTDIKKRRETSLLFSIQVQFLVGTSSTQKGVYIYIYMKTNKQKARTFYKDINKSPGWFFFYFERKSEPNHNIRKSYVYNLHFSFPLNQIETNKIYIYIYIYNLPDRVNKK